MKNQRIHLSRGDLLFQILVYTVLGLLSLIVLYPLIYVVSASFTSPAALVAGKMYLWPVNPTVSSYKAVLRESRLWIGYKNTIFYTLLGVSINIVMTVLGAYPLSRKDLVGRKVIMALITFTMFFSGGMIPLYLIIRNLGMIDTVWAVVLPGAISVHNLIIAKFFFSSSIPFELQESAFVDGCSNIRTLLTIIIPLSAPILAVLTMYYGVAHWNAYFNAMMYLSDSKKFPLQIALREILMTNSIADATDTTMNSVDQILLYEGLKYAVVIVASLPVMCLYPFLQRYFVKGTMIGAVKG